MDVVCERMSESALLLRLGNTMDPAVNARVHAACAVIRDADFPALEDIVPAYASILLRWNWQALERDELDIDTVQNRVCNLLSEAPESAAASEIREHRIPVCYDAQMAPDMDEVERVSGLSRDRIIQLHSAGEYHVAMIGFTPGFAYLLGMDERLNVPRREHPRTRVPRGSVAIGGAQTGIYPEQLPGGWQLIGRTPLTLFDAGNTQRPCLLAPGDRVRFEVIDKKTWDKLQEKEART
jgi:KipI family sensor histidine kinase inhibitor